MSFSFVSLSPETPTKKQRLWGPLLAIACNGQHITISIIIIIIVITITINTINTIMMEIDGM